MDTNKPAVAEAQAQTPFRPFRIVRPPIIIPPGYETPRQRLIKRRIRIERAIMMIARTRCDTRTACRRFGFDGRDLEQAAREVRRLCDERGIDRRHWWGRPIPNWKSQVPQPVHVKPEAT